MSKSMERRLAIQQRSAEELDHEDETDDAVALREAEVEIDRLRESAAWQPIETAPKDGRSVLLAWPYWSREPMICRFGWCGKPEWTGSGVLSDGGEGPTHWMPLPSSPK